MLNKYYRYCIFLLILFFNSSLSAQSDSLSSEISLKTILENDNVPLNKEVIYHVELSWQGELSQYKIGDIGDPVVTNLTLRGSGSSNRITTGKDGKPLAIKRITYYFKPNSMGMAYIDGLTIQYTDTQTNKSETLSAQRIGVKIVDPVETGEDQFMPGTILLWLLAAAFLIAFAYFLFRYIQRRNKVEKEEIPSISLEEKYLNLQNDTIHMANGASRENISELSKLLSGYLSEKFAITGNIDLSTIKEQLSQLKVEDEIIEKISIMYDKAELARFAGEDVDLSEVHMFYDTIEGILNKINNDEKLNTGD